MSFQVAEGSSGVGTERIFKDRNMPDGDACWPDGTLKDASKMDFPNLLSDVLGNSNLPELPVSKNEYFFLNLKRKLPGNDFDEDDSSSISDGHPKTKVNYIYSQFWKTYQCYGV
jgi:hypothetical protein